MDPQDTGREEFLRLAGRLYDEMLARVGPETGESFDDIELRALRAAKELAAGLAAQRLAAEEAATVEEVRCPGCGLPMRRPPGVATRQLQTMSGTVTYARRHAQCARCGASFSPSRPASGDPRAGRLRPLGPPSL